MLFTQIPPPPTAATTTTTTTVTPPSVSAESCPLFQSPYNTIPFVADFRQVIYKVFNVVVIHSKFSTDRQWDTF